MRDSERMRTGFVLILLAAAVLVRFLLACGVQGADAIQEPDYTMRLETVSLRPKHTEAASAPSPVPEAEPTVEASAPELLLPVFAAQEAEPIQIVGKCSYSVNVADALQQDWRGDWDEPPAVLIVHTHGSEAYTPEPGFAYAGSENYRSTDPELSVVQVGRALARALEERGLTVYHDETMHDLQSFAYAYSHSGAAVSEALAAHPEIGFVLDLHRDAALNPDGSEFAATLRSGGADYARLMLVVGTDEGGLTHPGWQQNLSCAVQLQALLGRVMPGLTRDVDLRTERFNQQLLPGSLLIEVGAAGNTLSQAERSMEPLAEAVAQLLGARPTDVAEGNVY